MRPTTLAEVAGRCGGTCFGDPDLLVDRFVTDSREVRDGALFLAIRGEKFDGHDFVAGLVDRELKFGTLAERPVGGSGILVDNLITAIAQLGSSHRQTFSGPVIGITGSAGKTTTKELAAAALSPLGKVLKSPGNKNTEYTSPLVWSGLDDHKVAVIELAMRGFGQVLHLAEIHRPNVAVVTNIGTAHIEMVGSREGIAKAKSEIFAFTGPNDTAILWQEDLYLDLLRQKAPRNVLTFGFSVDADARIVGYRPLDWSRSEVLISMGGATHRAELPIVGRHQALNAAAAAASAMVAGVDAADAIERLASATMPPMRMEILRHAGTTYVVDTYNANPTATVAALQTLGELPAEGRKLAVLGSMREMGDYAETGYREVGRALAVSGVDFTLLYGDDIGVIYEEAIRAGLPDSRLDIAHSLEEVRGFIGRVSDGDVVLVKGSRALELERSLPMGVDA